jgi:hypothetical protein
MGKKYSLEFYEQNKVSDPSRNFESYDPYHPYVPYFGGRHCTLPWKHGLPIGKDGKDGKDGVT